MKLEVEEYHRLASSIPGQDFTRERVLTTRNLDATFTKWIYKVIKKEEQIKKKMEELLRVKTEVMSVIDNIKMII